MSIQKINTKTVRDAIKAKMRHVKGKVTVIKRDNAIVVRQDDGGSMRQVGMSSDARKKRPHVHRP